MFIDLQLHSNYSDGYFTPTQLTKFIAGQGVKVASLTDHNTVGGLDEFRQACRKYKIKPITGLELYVRLGNKKFNVLWYNYNDQDQELHDLLRQSQGRRRNKFRLKLNGLKKIGFKIETNKVLDKYNHYIPINHVIDDILAVPFNRKKIKRKFNNKAVREKDVISEYFRNKNFGVLHPSYLSFERILILRKKIGGQIILNHPAKHHYIQELFWAKLKRLGLDGVEILSPHHDLGSVMYIQHLARYFDFVTTGGSDFHRLEGSNDLLQTSWQYFKIDTKYLRKIHQII